MYEQSLIDEQTSYYRARAAEYDEWILRVGRYDRGEAHRRQWKSELGLVRQALRSLAPCGEALEIACGTGLWTKELAEISTSLTAMDSVAETIELNRRKTPDAGITYTIADIFEWDPKVTFDTIFFGFWLSHVPLGRFASFWNTVQRALRPGGNVFFVDSLMAQRSTAVDHHKLDHSGIVERRLNSGKPFRIIKQFHEPKPLLQKLTLMGWTGEIRTTGEFFLYGNVHRAHEC